MPIHDWARVDDSLFHNLEHGWVVELSRRLNHGLLPSGYFALIETIDHRPKPGYLAMEEPGRRYVDPGRPGDVRDVADELPAARWVFEAAHVEYATRAVTVRDADTHHVVAAVHIITPQDKRTRPRLERFVERAAGALSHDIHLLVVDLSPPGPWDPHGIHKAIWDHVQVAPFESPPGRPLTLAAYEAGRHRAAYVEPVGVGDVLPDMPLFLSPGRYVPCPLEETYLRAWEALPAVLREELLGPPLG